MILNGTIKGNEEEEYTFIGGRGDTVIDYVVENREVKERIIKIKIGDRVDSDHQPVEITMEKGEESRERKGREKEGEGSVG